MKRSSNWINHVFNFISVILGVYLAFYVNERAQISTEKKERRLLIQSLINDLSSDIKAYSDYHIPINLQYKENIDSLLVLIPSNRVQEIEKRLPTLLQIENNTPTTSTYNSIKSSGKIRLIENLELQKALNDYYDGLAIECAKKNELQVEFFKTDIVPWLMSHANLIEMKLTKEIDSITLQNLLIIYYSWVNQKVRDYKLILEESKALKSQLEAFVE